jgi:hypothetical protein
VSGEPYVVRKFTLRELGPIVFAAGWLAILQLIGLHFQTVIIVGAAIYILFVTAHNLERLRVDDEGIHMRPVARIPWQHIERVTYRGPHELGLKLKPNSPVPRGVRGMIDGELTLPARGFELDQARLDQAVRAYSDAGGSFSGMPGSGASSSGMSAGGPSG